MDLQIGSGIGPHKQLKMSVNAIINASNLDISKVSFGDIRISKNNGSKSVPIKYNGQNFQMRIPKLRYPMGVSVKETENGTNYTMLASLQGCDSYAKERAPADAGEVGQMYNFLLDLQEKVIKTAVEKSASWFGRARKEDVLRDSMKSLVSPSVEKQGAEWVPNGKYPPSFRMKVPVYANDKGVPTVSMDAVDMANRPIVLTPENLEQAFPKRMEARFIVTPSIYVSGQGFGVTWRISYAQVSAQQRVTAAQMFEPEETAEEEKPAAAEIPTAEEDHEEQEQEEIRETPSAAAPVAAATPAPAKQARRRVATSAM
jgi:hypothetical protein